MGAGQSKTDADEKVFYETPVQFSQEVVNHLSDRLTSAEMSPERQTTLDSLIRSRIQAELLHLRDQEESVRKEIEHALEKENLDRERNMAGQASEGEVSGAVKSSAALIGDLEEIQRKVDRFQVRRERGDFQTAKASGAAVVSCYRANPQTPLQCWQEVNAFKFSVAKVEQEHFHSLH